MTERTYKKDLEVITVVGYLYTEPVPLILPQSSVML